MEKWASYGFRNDGILHLEEYYPNATYETYKGVSGYIYSTNLLLDGMPHESIPDVVISNNDVPVQYCEYIPDAYDNPLNPEITPYEFLDFQGIFYFQKNSDFVISSTHTHTLSS